MHFEFNRYSSLLLIFFVHGLVYALLLLRRCIRQERSSDGWLALFLVLCILYITPWMVGFAGWYDNQPYRDILLYVPFQQQLLLGPVVFFYVQSLLNPSFRFNKKAALHFLPAVLYLLLTAAIAITDKIILKQYYFLASGQDPDFDSWYQHAGFISMSVYLLLSLRYLRWFRKLMLQVTSYADKLRFTWVRNFLLAFLLMLCLRVLFFIVSFFVPYDYSDSWSFYMLFGLIFYYMAICGYGNTAGGGVAFQPRVLQNKTVLLLSAPGGTTEDADFVEVETAPGRTEPDLELAESKRKIEDLMGSEKCYENPELSLTYLASRLKIPVSQLSRIINQGFGCNFNDFVNGYRVAAVKSRLAAGEQRLQTLLGIALDCGFNSKATFNRAFKKATGMSPSEYLQQTKDTDNEQHRTFEPAPDNLMQNK